MNPLNIAKDTNYREGKGNTFVEAELQTRENWTSERKKAKIIDKDNKVLC